MHKILIFIIYVISSSEQGIQSSTFHHVIYSAFYQTMCHRNVDEHI